MTMLDLQLVLAVAAVFVCVARWVIVRSRDAAAKEVLAMALVHEEERAALRRAEMIARAEFAALASRSAPRPVLAQDGEATARTARARQAAMWTLEQVRRADNAQWSIDGTREAGFYEDAGLGDVWMSSSSPQRATPRLVLPPDPQPCARCLGWPCACPRQVRVRGEQSDGGER